MGKKGVSLQSLASPRRAGGPGRSKYTLADTGLRKHGVGRGLGPRRCCGCRAQRTQRGVRKVRGAQHGSVCRPDLGPRDRPAETWWSARTFDGAGPARAGPLLLDGRCDLDLLGSGPWLGPQCLAGWDRPRVQAGAQQVGGPACPSAPLGSPPLAPHEEAVGSVCHGSRPWPHGSCFLRPGRPAPGGRWWQRWPALGRLVWGAWSCSRPTSASFWLGDLVPLRL